MIGLRTDIPWESSHSILPIPPLDLVKTMLCHVLQPVDKIDSVSGTKRVIVRRVVGQRDGQVIRRRERKKMTNEQEYDAIEGKSCDHVILYPGHPGKKTC